MSNILKRLKKAISNDDDKEINIISHEIMAKDEELEDQGLSFSELDHVVGACMRTGFPNFSMGTREHKSPYLKK